MVRITYSSDYIENQVASQLGLSGESAPSLGMYGQALVTYDSDAASPTFLM
jgi:hypothetical protein